ncbi:hypothetical protein [Streptomyces sp. NBC_00343]|uniref:hypothetical protein n=1 Tax=Streptomyces sp. NBC_00343 TaxID=2975719 RepID=UPI002E2855DC|nr:hypothetical protein [Streptomyces sp. NBC_00343]
MYEESRTTDEPFWSRHLSAWIATGHGVVSSATGNPGLSSARYPDIAAVSEELRHADRRSPSGLDGTAHAGKCPFRPEPGDTPDA